MSVNKTQKLKITFLEKSAFESAVFFHCANFLIPTSVMNSSFILETNQISCNGEQYIAQKEKWTKQG